MHIIVCPLRDVHSVHARRTPHKVISLLDPGSSFPDIADHPTSHHLRLEMHDITTQTALEAAPSGNHVTQLFDFIHDWDLSRPLLVHCYAGISRSTAAAFAIACKVNPDALETSIAHALREASPTATPNMRLVTLADDLLDRKGRMVQAVRSIGTGNHFGDWDAGREFALPVSFEWTR